MNDTLQLIEQLIAEHKVMNEKTTSIEKAANDATLLKDLKEAKDSFVPGRFDQGKGVLGLQEMLGAIHIWLDKHFNREETALLSSVETTGDRKLVNTLKQLLDEHTNLRDRLAKSMGLVGELAGGTLARHRWNSSANDIRAHINHTRKLLESHAGKENVLFVELRRYFQAQDRKEEKTP
ncbi:MAG: hypothetical protein A2Z29_08285 [Chloroflexi bacterium RBG_16_56_11]|nr:MAG: hypothetical protein A2Z29_08285 [Chloroflexi bacterium RBG_16_56_11]